VDAGVACVAVLLHATPVLRMTAAAAAAAAATAATATATATVEFSPHSGSRWLRMRR